MFLARIIYYVAKLEIIKALIGLWGGGCSVFVSSYNAPCNHSRFKIILDFLAYSYKLKLFHYRPKIDGIERKNMTSLKQKNLIDEVSILLLTRLFWYFILGEYILQLRTFSV